MAVIFLILGPASITHSLWGMGLVVLSKCVAFGIYEKRIPFLKGASLVLVGNIASTLAGLGIAIPFAAPSAIYELSGLFVVLPVIVTLCSLPPFRRLFRFWGKPQFGVGSALAFIITSSFFCILFFSLATVSLEEGNFSQYWMMKFAYIAFGFLIGIGITTIYEEWVIFKLCPPQEGEPYYMKSVFYANLTAFLVAGAFGAMLMLPQRLHSPYFLVEMIKEWLSAMV
jgi:hypothetical protein